jgi:Phytanoyl-CoA dioxygenase (PhyH)
MVTETADGKRMRIERPRRFECDADMAEFYDRNGYVAIKGLFEDTAVLAPIRDDLSAIFAPFAMTDGDQTNAAIIALDRSDKAKLHELHVISSRVASLKQPSLILQGVIRRISGSPAPVLEIAAGYLLGIPDDDRLVYDFHQEANYMKGFDDIYNAHYPLFRASTTENGTMSVLPGSHKLGTLPFRKSRSAFNSYTDLVPVDIKRIVDTHDEVHCYLEPGDCVIFHKNLVHRSNYNASDTCRVVGVARLTQSLVGDWIPRRPDEL